jgi:hypothetical protein
MSMYAHQERVPDSGRERRIITDPHEAQVQRSRQRVDELLSRGSALTPEEAGELSAHRRYASPAQQERISAAQTARRDRRQQGRSGGGRGRQGSGDRVATQRDVQRLMRESEQRIRDALDGVV